MEPTLVIFSGLPSTGKSTLASRLARELQWALLCIDDLTSEVPKDAGPRFWDEKNPGAIAIGRIATGNWFN